VSDTDDNPCELLLRILADQPLGYRQRMRPADIIELSLIERRKSMLLRPIGLIDFLRKLVLGELNV
jgi:hypothetical protein